ncbi:MAG TPA: L,D-transpeptidase family protein [Acidimicrobiia bacterium]|nr:L,D-transpeptidase family protein [Acidimicrobiia bacterium]
MIRARLLILALVVTTTFAAAAPSFAWVDPVGLTQTVTRTPGETIANPPAFDLKPGSTGSLVTLLQEKLQAAGFFPGGIDGVYGQSTLAAVFAFQKLYDRERSGVFRAEDWPLLDRQIEGPGPGPEPDRVEIDLARQIMYLIESERVTGVFPISSANGEPYRNAAGRVVNASTPEGRFTFRRTRDGWWRSYLGYLYRPFYFYGGYAIHGSRSVPPFPASHGCVRVEIDDMDFLATRLEVGMAIYLYGDDVSRDTLIEPPPPAPPPVIPGLDTL